MIIEQFARWQLLAWVLTFRLVCRPLRKIYPDLKSLEATGHFFSLLRFCIATPNFFFS